MNDEPYDPDHLHIKRLRYSGTRLDIPAMTLVLSGLLGCERHEVVGRALERGMVLLWKERLPNLPPPVEHPDA